MTDKLYVHCFQPFKPKLELPVMVEFVRQIGKEVGTARCVIKHKGVEYTVHRGACSETPFTMADMEKYKPIPKAAKAAKAAAAVKTDEPPTPKAAAIAKLPKNLGSMFK